MKGLDQGQRRAAFFAGLAVLYTGLFLLLLHPGYLPPDHQTPPADRLRLALHPAGGTDPGDDRGRTPLYAHRSRTGLRRLAVRPGAGQAPGRGSPAVYRPRPPGVRRLRPVLLHPLLRPGGRELHLVRPGAAAHLLFRPAAKHAGRRPLGGRRRRDHHHQCRPLGGGSGLLPVEPPAERGRTGPGRRHFLRRRGRHPPRDAVLRLPPPRRTAQCAELQRPLPPSGGPAPGVLCLLRLHRLLSGHHGPVRLW